MKTYTFIRKKRAIFVPYVQENTSLPDDSSPSEKKLNLADITEIEDFLEFGRQLQKEKGLCNIPFKWKKLSVFVLVSPEDYDDLKNIPMRLRYDKGKFYVWCKPDKGSVIWNLLHRYLMKTPDKMVCDHINGFTFDASRSNLRNTTARTNALNKLKKSGKYSSNYHGVYFVKKLQKFAAVVNIDSRIRRLGVFHIELEAAETRDTYLVQNNIQDTRPLNFPKKIDEFRKRPKVELKTITVNKTGYIGVAPATLDGTEFLASISINNKNYSIGLYDSAIEAAHARDQYICDNQIPRQKLNFPKDHSDYNFNCAVRTKCTYVDENTVALVIRGIPNGKVLLDREDYDRIKCYSCIQYNRKSAHNYIVVKMNRKNVYLHRYVMKVTDENVKVDHDNSNVWDNRKSNLILTDAAGNSYNKRKCKNATSKYIGVSLKRNEYWTGSVAKKYEIVFNASNGSEEKVARFRDLFIRSNLSEYGRFKQNFSDWTPELEKYWKKKTRDMMNNRAKYNNLV